MFDIALGELRQKLSEAAVPMREGEVIELTGRSVITHRQVAFAGVATEGAGHDYVKANNEDIISVVKDIASPKGRVHSLQRFILEMYANPLRNKVDILSLTGTYFAARMPWRRHAARHNLTTMSL